MLRLMVTTGFEFFLCVVLNAGRYSAACGAEGRCEKAKNDQQRTEVREETVLAGAHVFIVRGVGETVLFFEGGKLVDRCGGHVSDFLGEERTASEGGPYRRKRNPRGPS
jgi:hypothetical protein